MERIVGNGQPGRLKLLEDAVGQLKWWIVGAALLSIIGSHAPAWAEMIFR